MLTIRDFKGVSHAWLIKQKRNCYNKYSEPILKPINVGRKYVIVNCVYSTGIRFMETSIEEDNYLQEYSEYSSEYKLFKTKEEALRFIEHEDLIREIEMAGNKIDKLDNELLKEIYRKVFGKEYKLDFE